MSKLKNGRPENESGEAEQNYERLFKTYEDRILLYCTIIFLVTRLLAGQLGKDGAWESSSPMYWAAVLIGDLGVYVFVSTLILVFAFDNGIRFKNINKAISTKERILIISFIVFIAFYIIFRILLPGMKSEKTAASYIRDSGLYMVVATMIISGIREIRQNGPNLKRFISPFCGMLIVAVCLIGSEMAMKTMLSKADQVNEMKEANRREIEAVLASSTTAEKKAIMSKILSSDIYFTDGTVTSYIKSDGSTELYVPTEDEKEMRSEFLEANVSIKYSTSAYFIVYIKWAFLVVTSCILGSFTAISKEERNA